MGLFVPLQTVCIWQEMISQSTKFHKYLVLLVLTIGSLTFVAVLAPSAPTAPLPRPTPAWQNSLMRLPMKETQPPKARMVNPLNF